MWEKAGVDTKPASLHSGAWDVTTWSIPRLATAERTELVFLPFQTMQTNLMSHMPIFLPGHFFHAPTTGTGLTLKQILPDNDSKREQNLTPYVTHNNLRGALGLVLLGSLDSDKTLSPGVCACNHCAMLNTELPLQTPRVPAYSDSCIGLAGKIFIDGHAFGSWTSGSS